MIEYIRLRHAGPGPSMNLRFGSRLNLLTGDNGLGKTFALDIAWWALTQTWASLPAWPRRGHGIEPAIEYRLIGEKESDQHVTAIYDFPTQSWPTLRKTPSADSLVVYVRADGGISLRDPAKDFHRHSETAQAGQSQFPNACHFAREDIWNGLSIGEKILCNGLIRDWVSWQYQQNDLFKSLGDVLKLLSPHADEIIRPGPPARISVEDVRDIPTVELPYGMVPVTHASAGMRRILAIAYFLVWAWNEHRSASALLNREPTNKLLVLFDEVEAHLHPRWQRILLPALLSVTKIFQHDTEVQIIASTHAPLILASVETKFCESTDKILTFDLHEGKVSASEIPWARQGDVAAWLVSEAFGLRQARSADAERAIDAAEAFMRGDVQSLPDSLKTREIIHQELLQVLPGHDSFWPRWIVKTEGTEDDQI